MDLLAVECERNIDVKWMSFVMGLLDQYMSLTLGDKDPDKAMRKAHEWGQELAKIIKKD